MLIFAECARRGEPHGRAAPPCGRRHLSAPCRDRSMARARRHRPPAQKGSSASDRRVAVRASDRSAHADIARWSGLGAISRRLRKEAASATCSRAGAAGVCPRVPGARAPQCRRPTAQCTGCRMSRGSTGVYTNSLSSKTTQIWGIRSACSRRNL